MNEPPPESGGEEKRGALETLCFHGLRLSESTLILQGGEEMTLEDRLRSQGVKVNGTFDVQNFFDIFARILSRKYGIEITVKAIRKSEDEENQEGNICEQAS